MKTILPATISLYFCASLLPATAVEEEVLTNRALLGLLKPLPEVAESEANPITEAKVQLEHDGSPTRCVHSLNRRLRTAVVETACTS